MSKNPYFSEAWRPNDPIPYAIVGDPIDNNNPGIKWKGSFHTPNSIGGEIGFVQLVKSTAEVGGKKYSTGKEYYLDTRFPYASQNIDTSVPIDSIVAFDNPGTQLLAPKISRDDYFQVYLIYKPPGMDSIWTSCAMLTWDLRYELVYIGLNLDLDDWRETLPVTVVPHPSNKTNVLPTWDKNILNIPLVS